MKTIDQTVQKLALPPFLRKGLEAVRVGSGNKTKYHVKSKSKNQTYEFEPWQFFILEVLPSCDDFPKLASVFKDRFGHIITESEVKKFFSLVINKGLFGENAISHPMLASYKNMNTTLLQLAKSINEAKEKANTHSVSSSLVEPPPATSTPKYINPNRNASSDRGLVENEETTSMLGTHAMAFDNKVVIEEGEEQGYLVKAMQKAKMSASLGDSSKTERSGQGPIPSSHNKNDQGHLRKVAVPEVKTTLSAEIKSGVSLKNVTDSPANDGEIKSPESTEDTIDTDDSISNKGLKIFDPRWLLKLLYPLFLPIRHTIYLLPLLLIVDGFIMYSHHVLLTRDFQLFMADTSFIKHALVSMLTVNLTVTLATGLIAYGFRATVSGFCIVFYMFFFPRFMVRIGNLDQLLRREQIWLHAGPLLLRLGFCSIGILAWFSTRAAHPLAANFALALATAGAISFFITVSPFVKSSGYHLLSAVLNEPHLKNKMYEALLNKFRGKVYSKADSNVLTAYALTSIVYVFALIAGMLYVFGNYLKLQLGPASILGIALFALYILWRMISQFLKFEEAYQRTAQFERWRNRTLPKGEDDTKEEEPPKAIFVYLQRSVLILIVAVLFLPYTYEPGGNFIVLPNEQQTISAEIAGIIENINYDGGEILSKGTVIGQLSYSDYSAQVRIYNAKIAQQKAAIDDLKSKPKPEEVLLAQTELKTQRTHAEFSKGKATRLQDLFKQGVVSLEDLEDAKRIYEVDLDQIKEKMANLELVKSGATPQQLEEAEAKLQSLIEERDSFQNKIEQSVFHMPFDGKLVTMNLKQKIGSYLNKGEPLAVAEQANQVKVEIEVPESDIGYVKENSEVRCRFQVYNDREFDGVVKTIDSNVTEENYGKVIKVVTLLENEDRRLKSGMTGYAKITGEQMPLWKVLSMAFIRFFKVEVWSWLP